MASVDTAAPTAHARVGIRAARRNATASHGETAFPTCDQPVGRMLWRTWLMTPVAIPTATIRASRVAVDVGVLDDEVAPDRHEVGVGAQLLADVRGGVIGVEQDHDPLALGRFADLGDDLVTDGRAHEIADPGVDGQALGGRDVDGQDRAMPEQVHDRGEVQRAAAQVRPGLDDEVRARVDEDLLVRPQVERALERPVPEPRQVDRAAGLAAALVPALVVGAVERVGRCLFVLAQRSQVARRAIPTHGQRPPTEPGKPSSERAQAATDGGDGLDHRRSVAAGMLARPMTDGRIRYVTSLDGITADDLAGGFWVGWPTPPTPAVHLASLRGSEAVVLAIDDGSAAGTPGRVVGFVNAIGDGVLAAFVPNLEVLPAWQGQGIGSELVRRLLDALGPRYVVDLVCDDDLVPFYERLGLSRYTAMIRRDRRAIMTAADRFPADPATDTPQEA
jgi:GNAT superfamily N-acetyltransferase